MKWLRRLDLACGPQIKDLCFYALRTVPLQVTPTTVKSPVHVCSEFQVTLSPSYFAEVTTDLQLSTYLL